MAGRLTGTIDGLPVTITGTEEGVALALGGVTSLWPLLRSARQAKPLLDLLAAVEISLTVTLAGLTLPVLPRPHWLVRFLLR